MSIQRKLRGLRRRGRALYYYLIQYDNVSCGSSLLEYIKPEIKQKRKKLLAICRLIRILER